MTTLTASFTYLDRTYHVDFELERLDDEVVCDLLTRVRETAGSGAGHRLYHQAVVHPIFGWDLTSPDGRLLPVSGGALGPPLPAGIAALLRDAMTTRAQQYRQGLLGTPGRPRSTPRKGGR
jgi:hypothetical protein